MASKVRIFPLLTLLVEVSPHLQPLIEELKIDRFSISVEKVSYKLREVEMKCSEFRRPPNEAIHANVQKRCMALVLPAGEGER